MLRKPWWIVPILLAAGAALRVHAAESVLSQGPEGVLLDGNLVSGAALLQRYTPHQPAARTAAPGQDRERNRGTIQRFFALPIGADRARLYARDGVKQIPAMGVQWRGMDNQLRNNEQNTKLFPGWAWNSVVIWDTQDPTVFWAEAEGATAPGATPHWANHYVMQYVVEDGAIVLFREFGTPVNLSH
ncbi:MAG: PhzA/PhzB family protein [Gammaproteobacteria bacterium]|nr:PhzA/PhzB family protein [Gammaproteobacteria bacterium]